MVITVVTIVLWTSLFSLYLLSLLSGRFIVSLDNPFVYTVYCSKCRYSFVTSVAQCAYCLCVEQ